MNNAKINDTTITTEDTKKPNDCDGYISKIRLPNGKMYKLKCEIAEVRPISCTRCGASFELHNGHGKCEHCGTNYSAVVSVVED